MLEELVLKDEVLLPYYDHIKSFTDDKYRAIIEWYLCMKEGLKAKEKYIADVLIVKYEDLVSDPEQILNKILKHCRLNNDPVMFTYALEVLKPAPNKPKFELPEFIQEPVTQLCKQLGYNY